MQNLAPNLAPTRAEIPFDGFDSGKYALASPTETLTILRNTCEQGDLITLAFKHGHDFDLLTSTVEISADDRGLIFDQGNNPELNRKALQSDMINCYSLQENAKIHFLLNGVNPGKHNGRDVFLSPLPDSLIRVQRREDYRLALPQVNPVLAKVPVQQQDGLVIALQAVVIDISGGGMCLRISPDYPSLDKDARLCGVTFTLPNVGMVTADMRVRNVHEEFMPNGKTYQRAVCQFVNLPTPMINLVQRYIFRTQRERIARGVC
ncbi:MAG: flagellar brake protein [Rhodocyclaceae bacterium]|nr:MAG: flagellar brake protein [Rhodocyclaceae bacterium]